jgi:hypothetical protein
MHPPQERLNVLWLFDISNDGRLFSAWIRLISGWGSVSVEGEET